MFSTINCCGVCQVGLVLTDLQFMTIGLYVTAVWALPLLESVKQSKTDSRPSFFMTGGGIWEQPIPEVFALSVQKAAQVNLARTFEQIAGPKGVHVATVSVNGPVQDSDPVLNAKNIASKFWDLYLQESGNWENLPQIG